MPHTVTRPRGLIAAAVVMALAALAIVGTVRAQSNGWVIVQGGDGSLYALKADVRYELAPSTMSDADLAALPDGGPISPAFLPDAPQTEPTVQPSVPAPVPLMQLTVQGASPGGSAGATVVVGVTCSIVYITPAGTNSRAQGLVPKTTNASGAASWSWLIGTATRPGIGSVSVTCAGTTNTSPISIG